MDGTSSGTRGGRTPRPESSSRCDDTKDSTALRTNIMRRHVLLIVLFVVSLVSIVSFVSTHAVLLAQPQDEVTRLLQQYVRIDTSNPPGDTRKAADFLAGVLDGDGIAVTRYESEPGKAILYARLKATVSPPAGKAVILLHHMDVVPADR